MLSEHSPAGQTNAHKNSRPICSLFRNANSIPSPFRNIKARGIESIHCRSRTDRGIILLVVHQFSSSAAGFPHPLATSVYN